MKPRHIRKALGYMFAAMAGDGFGVPFIEGNVEAAQKEFNTRKKVQEVVEIFQELVDEYGEDAGKDLLMFQAWEVRVLEWADTLPEESS